MAATGVTSSLVSQRSAAMVARWISGCVAAVPAAPSRPAVARKPSADSVHWRPSAPSPVRTGAP